MMMVMTDAYVYIPEKRLNRAAKGVGTGWVMLNCIIVEMLISQQDTGISSISLSG